MQRQEIKTLTIMFNPYRIGPVIGKIIIKHYVKEGGDSQQHKMVHIYYVKYNRSYCFHNKIEKEKSTPFYIDRYLYVDTVVAAN